MSETLNLEAGATRRITDKEAMKVSIGALIGTAMEWYDFFLFSAAAALVFNVQYFANENATAAAHGILRHVRRGPRGASARAA